MKHALFLATRALWWYRGRTTTIVLCLMLTLWLPVTVRLVLRQFQQEIAWRSQSTPLVIGAPGSRVDLVLHALYLQTRPATQISMSEVEYINGTGFATAIPLNARYLTQGKNGAAGVPIVGTSIEYFEFRNLQTASGTRPLLLGDCVVGAEAARKLRLNVGDTILSASQNAFDIAGDYPLQLKVVGVLQAAHSPDDEVVFTDVTTTWVIAGIGHGHQSLEGADVDPGLLLQSDQGSVTANAAVLPYTQITESNIDSFHFHGDPGTFPLTAVIAVPASEKSRILLMGRYAAARDSAQCLKPGDVIGELMAIVLRVEQLMRLSSLLAAIVTTLMLSLVLFLSLRLRAAEINTMFCLGCSRGTIARIVGSEILLMLGTAAVLSSGLAIISTQLASDVLRSLLF
ncbi:MAG: ABC transporter permease [Planctomycetaceae bacterium]|nr:ABC transporter permease [Planctomycetaceae bacterium]